MLAIRLPQDVEERLTRLAERTGRTKTFYARQAILVHLDQLEDEYWEDEVIERWESSDRSTVPAADLRRELDL